MPTPYLGANVPRKSYAANLFQPDQSDAPETPVNTGNPAIRTDPDTQPVEPATRPRQVTQPDNRLRYEDLAGPRRPLSPLPEYQPLPERRTKGFLNRTLGALSGFGVGAMEGGDPARSIGMAIRGAVQPDIPHRQLWEKTALPQAMERRKLELAMREAEDGQVDNELRRRERISLINARENPAFRQVSGAEVSTLYDPRTGKRIILDDETGNPISAASVRTTEMRGQQGTELEKQRQGGRELLLEKNITGRKMLQEDQQEFRNQLQTKIGGQQMERTQAQIGATDRRTIKLEAGRNARHAGTLAAKSSTGKPSTPKADAGNITTLLQQASPRLLERMKGMSPAQQAAEWNRYYGIF